MKKRKNKKGSFFSETILFLILLIIVVYLIQLARKVSLLARSVTAQKEYSEIKIEHDKLIQELESNVKLKEKLDKKVSRAYTIVKLLIATIYFSINASAWYFFQTSLEKLATINSTAGLAIFILSWVFIDKPSDINTYLKKIRLTIENHVYKKHRALKENIEKQKIQIEEKKNRLEQLKTEINEIDNSLNKF